MRYLSLRPCAWLEAIQRLYHLKRKLVEERKKERMKQLLESQFLQVLLIRLEQREQMLTLPCSS